MSEETTAPQSSSVERIKALEDALRGLINWAEGKCGDDLGTTEWRYAKEVLRGDV